jgi:hypothetical protein
MRSAVLRVASLPNRRLQSSWHSGRLSLTPRTQLLFIFVLLAAFFEWIAFWINLGFVLNTRSNISRDTGGLWTGHIGNAFWLSLGSALALSFATCFAGVSSFSEEERRDRDATNVRPVPQVHEKPGRRWPWVPTASGCIPSSQYYQVTAGIRITLMGNLA